MRKTKAEPKAKKKNVEPIEAAPQLTIEEIESEIIKHWKLIDNSNNYEEYALAWKNYDKYTDLKREHFKK